MPKIGAGRIQKRQEQKARYEQATRQLQSDSIEAATKNFAAFQESLRKFASKHKDHINRDARFRQQFHQMCSAVGVDPLISNRGFWQEILGLGTFYTELGVQILTVCFASREENGGILELEECRRKVKSLRGPQHGSISKDDLIRAIDHLAVLGKGGVSILRHASHRRGEDRCFVVCVPDEMSDDQATVLAAAQESADGCVTKEDLCTQLSWSEERSLKCLTFFVREGMAWIDDGGSGGCRRLFWFPGISFGKRKQTEP